MKFLVTSMLQFFNTRDYQNGLASFLGAIRRSLVKKMDFNSPSI